MRTRWYGKNLKPFLVILAITGGVLAVLFAAMKIYYWNVRQDLFRDERAALESAEELWAERRPQQYQLVLQQWFQGIGFSEAENPCEQEYLVIGQQVNQIINAQNCNQMFDSVPPTIEELFDIANKYLLPDNCGYNGCVCDGPIDTQVRYNTTLGYPEEILQRGFLQNEHWRYTDIDIFSPPFCTHLGTGFINFRITTFLPNE